MPEHSLDEALDALEREAGAALRALSSAAKAAKRAKAAAAVGRIKDLQQALDASAQLAAEAADAASALRSAWDFDVAEWFASGQYLKELLGAATEAGLSAFESDGTVLSYPVIVRVSPLDTTVLVDKRKERGVRPSAVVRHLSTLQQKPPNFKADAFIEALAVGYDYVAKYQGLRPGAVAKLVDVHKVLTLLPGSAREYTRQEFARDLYLLDQREVTETKDGRLMSLPASALTRDQRGVLVTVTRGGQQKVYAGISFTEKPSRQ